MNVIYSLSAAPYLAKNSGVPFSAERFDLYTAAISSLTRRRGGDKTTMHCDGIAADYLHHLGVDKLWDKIAVTIPSDFEGINPLMFWAAGKLFALRKSSAPLLMLDTDFIAWNLPRLNSKIVAAHFEELAPNVYPPIDYFNMRGYTFDKSFNYRAKPLNTAFLYLPSQDFKNYYVERALRFMKAAVSCGDYLCYMVFAEQRLLAMCAERKGVSVGTVLDYKRLFTPQKNYTHLWGAKQKMRDNRNEYERFCGKCRDRIRRDFPEYEYIIDLIEKQT